MLGRMALWDGGRGFGVDRDEQAAAGGKENIGSFLMHLHKYTMMNCLVFDTRIQHGLSVSSRQGVVRECDSSRVLAFVVGRGQHSIVIYVRCPLLCSLRRH